MMSDSATEMRAIAPPAAEEPRRAAPTIDDRPASTCPDSGIGLPAGGRRTIRRFLSNRAGSAALAFLLAIVAIAFCAPWLYPDDPLSMVAQPFLWPGQNAEFPLGTDSLGRDVAAGIVWGARVSLLVGFAAMALGVAFGVFVGSVAGFFGGRIDNGLLRLTEIFQTMPSFILLVVLVAIAQPSIPTIILGISLVTWPTVARLVRAEFRSLKEKEFVVAARSLGAGSLRLIAFHILPNTISPIIVTSSILVASAILMESALSFLGLGDPNLVSWGSMIGSGRELLRTAWYLTAIPGLAIILTVLALNIAGDALNDALNPRAPD
ncbi:ABC transporter permease [Bosea sp. RCC_152_1]|uniref:ABC transporter permease n=1 Tax=Bosea sp. RCC_152_1 TaxID=3239228 RepID=UPI0035255A82